MARFDDLAKYLSQLLGNLYDIKYFSNKEIDWEKIVIADDMVYGSMKVIGGNNQSLKDIHTMTDELAITMMIKADEFGAICDHIDAAFKSIDKSLILIGEDYVQFTYSQHTDLNQYVFDGEYYNGVTFYISVLSFVDLFLSDTQTIELFVSNTWYKLLGVTGIVNKTQWSFDGVVNSAIQKQYVAGVVEDIVADGICVSGDVCRGSIKNTKLTNRTLTIRYFDGETSRTIDMKLGSYTQIGIAGNLIKYQLSLIRKE